MIRLELSQLETHFIMTSLLQLATVESKVFETLLKRSDERLEGEDD